MGPRWGARGVAPIGLVWVVGVGVAKREAWAVVSLVLW